MKAITLMQPWATLVAIGAKQIETRSWKTSYRGRLAIHAGIRKVPGGSMGLHKLILREPFKSVLDAYQSQHWWTAPLPIGVVIATVELYDIRPTTEIVDSIPMNEMAFGDYSPGRYAWMLRNVERFPVAIEAKGALSLWEWQQPTMQQICEYCEKRTGAMNSQYWRGSDAGSDDGRWVCVQCEDELSDRPTDM